MKKNLHPISQKTVFQDMTTGASFLVDSTMETAESIVWTDGNSYPLVKIEISSASHPTFTGRETEAKQSSRAEKFRARYEKPDLH